VKVAPVAVMTETATAETIATASNFEINEGWVCRLASPIFLFFGANVKNIAKKVQK
jgi:hypothetical protein